MESELTPAARRLVKWDHRRSKFAGILGFDISVDPVGYRAQHSGVWAGGDLRAVPSLVVWSMVTWANSDFYRVAHDEIGLEKVEATEDTFPPGYSVVGHPADPLVQFPNGLILKSVAAAEYVLERADMISGHCEISHSDSSRYLFE